MTISSILPNNRYTFLPISPTDGQRFVDAQLVQWIYNGKEGIWERRGTADELPLATLDQIGLLSPQDKNLIDSIPAVGGGFGIITDTKLLLQSPTNPEGVITGDIKLKSDSLDIVCVGPDKTKLDCVIPDALECVGTIPAETPPGLTFKLSSKFLDTLFIDVRGPKGKTGYKGEKGDQGEPGYSEGPSGDKGIQGGSINELCTLDEIRYNDIGGITDTPIVGLNLVDDDGHGCKLVVTKAKINVEEGRSADKLVVAGLSRSLIYEPDADASNCDLTRLDDWTLVKSPGDRTPTNLQLLRLPKGTNETIDNPVGFNGTMTLEGFVGQLVNEYKDRLTKLDESWGKQVRDYINGLDDKARGILSNLANDVALCEFNLPAVEYGITFVGCEPTSPSAAAAQRAAHSPVTAGNNVATIGMGNRKWNVKS
jgi:hypothetical protein